MNRLQQIEKNVIGFLAESERMTEAQAGELLQKAMSFETQLDRYASKIFVALVQSSSEFNWQENNHAHNKDAARYAVVLAKALITELKGGRPV